MLPAYALYRKLNDVSAIVETSDILDDGELRLQSYKATAVGSMSVDQVLAREREGERERESVCVCLCVRARARALNQERSFVLAVF